MKQWIFLTVLALLLISCSNSDPGNDRQTNQSDNGRYETIMNKYNAQTERADEQLDRAEKQAERYEALLKRWEEQADRYDSLLKKWEAQSRNEQ